MNLLEDRVLVELRRAAHLAGRPDICVPSRDLDGAVEISGSRQTSYRAIERLVGRGRLARVRRDLLVFRDETGLINADLLGLVAAVASKPFLVTGGRALELSEVTDQHYFGVSILSPARVTRMVWKGETARFFLTDPARIWGAEPLPDLLGSTIPVASVERAILDSLYHPRYGVSLDQAVAALRKALAEPAFLARLKEATARYAVTAVARRVGFLVERLASPQAAEPFLAHIGSGPAPSLLRPGTDSLGEIDRRWRININVRLDLILEAVE